MSSVAVSRKFAVGPSIVHYNTIQDDMGEAVKAAERFRREALARLVPPYPSHCSR